jgi:hypothetical protein
MLFVSLVLLVAAPKKEEAKNAVLVVGILHTLSSLNFLSISMIKTQYFMLQVI